MKNKKVVFLLQNGIGFGHFKLALTISKYLSSDDYEIIFITQAKSTRIFQGYNYKVINIPPTYSLKNNNEVLFIHKLVNAIIEKIAPDLVIEDTYPDDFYLNLPSLLYVPKMLIINRLMATEFENYYFSGVLGQYSKLLILKERTEFLRGLTATEVKNYIAFSDRVFFCGSIFNEPTNETLKIIREKYHLDDYEKTVVVNCGAGGWHIGENICKSIFETLVDIANGTNLTSNKVQFVFLVGPYSKYLADSLQKNILSTTQVRIVDFEDHADALFHEADLVILRPGYNSTMEALNGKGQLILLPGISYLEEQENWCKELKELYEIDYVPVSNLKFLKAVVQKNLYLNSCKTRRVLNHAADAASMIKLLVLQNCVKNIQSVVLGIRYLGNCALVENVLESLYSLGVVNCKKNTICVGVDEICIINDSYKYDEFKELETIAVYMDEKMCLPDLNFYQSRYHFYERGIIVIPIYEICIIGDADFSIRKVKYAVDNQQLFSPFLCLNINDDCDLGSILLFLDWLKSEILNKQLNLYSVNALRCDIVNQRLLENKFQHSCPEITKLQW